MRGLRQRRRLFFSLPALLALSALAVAAQEFFPLPVAVSAHRFRLDPQTVTGAAALADFGVGTEGRPRDLKLRSGSEALRDLARSLLPGWRFELPPEAARNGRVALMILLRQSPFPSVEPRMHDLPPVDFPGADRPPLPRRIFEPSHPPQVPTDGVAILGVRVDAEGAVTLVKPFYGPDEFVSSVSEVVRAWEFEAARKDGHPVSGGLVLVVYFPHPSL